MKKSTLINRLISILLTIIIFTVVAVLFDYWFLTPWNIHSLEFWWLIALYGIFAIGINCLVGYICFRMTGYRKLALWKLDTSKEKFVRVFKVYPIAIIASIFTIAWIITILVTSIPSWKVFNAEKYANLLPVGSGDFNKDIISATSTDIVSVDVKTAQRLGDRTIGNIENASWYEVNNEYNLISINDEEYRISPLDYSGFFQALKANGLPGYVLVNAKTQQSQYVQLEKPMLYSPNAYFSKKLSRHLHNLYPTYMFADKSFFEVDDDGNPFWITAVKTQHIGLRSGFLEDTAVVTNAITGESTEYAIANLPEWIDHVHSVSYLMDLLKDHYGLQNGYFNFSNTNKFETAYESRDTCVEDSDSGQNNEFTPFDGYNSVLTSKGDIMFYTGITPTNTAETIIGFVLISPRTGEAKFYEVSGSEEYSAQIAAEGLVQNLHYSASFPTIINVDGIETYFMTLKDGAGLVQRYALCNVKQYSIVVEASSIEEAISKYKNRLGMEDNKTSNDYTDEEEEQQQQKQIKEISGIISQVQTAEIDGYTYFYFSLGDTNDVIFMSSIENSNEQPLMLVKDAKVSVKYYLSNDPKIAIVTEIVFN